VTVSAFATEMLSGLASLSVKVSRSGVAMGLGEIDGVRPLLTLCDGVSA